MVFSGLSVAMLGKAVLFVSLFVMIKQPLMHMLEVVLVAHKLTGKSVDQAEGEQIEGGGTGPKCSRKSGALTNISGPSKGLYVGVGPVMVPGTPAQPAPYALPLAAGARPCAEDRSIVAAAGGAAVLGNNTSMEKLPAETSS